MHDEPVIKFFSWGIFTNPHTCIRMYGRNPQVKKDSLSNWEIDRSAYRAIPKMGGKIEGIVLELTLDEFKRMDVFEEKYAFKSIGAITDSGEKVVFYVKKDDEIENPVNGELKYYNYSFNDH